MMSSLFKRSAHSAAAASQTATSLVAVNIYPLAITAAPSSPRAKACWVNRGWRWEINEQCCIWQRLRRAADEEGCCLKRWHVPAEKVTQVSDGCPAAICVWQLSPDFLLSSAHRRKPQETAASLEWPLPSGTLLLLSERLALHLLCLATWSSFLCNSI